MQHFKNCFAKFATFKGRARRAEFWYFVLFYYLGLIAIILAGGFFNKVIGTQAFVEFFMILLVGFSLLCFIPSISVTVRRLHDIDKSGWFIFVSRININVPFFRCY